METWNKRHNIHNGCGWLFHKGHHQAGRRSPFKCTRVLIWHQKILEGNIFLGLTPKWDYQYRTVDISIPKYVNTDLHKFHNPTHLDSQNSTCRLIRPSYGTYTQCANPENDSAPLPLEVLNIVRTVLDTFLYYALTVISTMFVALSNLASTQAKAKDKTYNNIVWLLNYAIIHPIDIVRYKKRNMIPRLNINVS